MTEATKSIALLKVHPAIQDAVRKATIYLHNQCGATVCEVSWHHLFHFQIKVNGYKLHECPYPQQQKSMFI